MANLTTKQLTVLVRKSYKIDTQHPLRRVSQDVPSFWHHFCSWLHLEHNGELTIVISKVWLYAWMTFSGATVQNDVPLESTEYPQTIGVQMLLAPSGEEEEMMDMDTVCTIKTIRVTLIEIWRFS